jgi:hypothetical protein
MDGVRSVLGVRVGARWQFLARAVDRGPARLVVTRQVPTPGTENMLESRVLVLLVPVEGGVRVAEVSSSVVATEVVAPLRAIALQTAMGEVRARTRGLRAHWREYLAAGAAEDAR